MFGEEKDYLDDMVYGANELHELLNIESRRTMFVFYLTRNCTGLCIWVLLAMIIQYAININIFIAMAAMLPVMLHFNIIRRWGNLCKTESQIVRNPRMTPECVETYIQTSLDNYNGIVVSGILDLMEVDDGKRHLAIIRTFYKGYVWVDMPTDLYEEVSSAFKNKSCSNLYIAAWKWNNVISEVR